MYILVVNHHSFLSPRVVQEMMSLYKKGFRIEVFNWCRNSTVIDNNFPASHIKVHNIKLRAPEGNLILILFLPVFYILLLIKILPKRFDIILCTHLMLLPFSVFVGKLKNAKIVYDSSELYSFNLSNYAFFLKKYAKFFIEFIENRLVALVDYVFLVDSKGNYLYNRYLKYNKNLIVLYNVPELSIEADEELLAFLKSKYKNKKIIIYVGGITESKGLIVSLKALRIVKEYFEDVKLLLVGKCKVSLKKIYSLIEYYGLRENIEIIDHLDYSKMLSYLEIAEIGLALYQPIEVYRKLSKMNSRKIFTYMQKSLPIIASNFGEIGKVVEEEKCGILVDSTNPLEVAGAILYLFNNPDRAREMGLLGRKAIESKYNWSKEEKKLLKAFEVIFENNHQKRRL